ncbi:Hypothetical protein NTJ_01385 [Nesidiocoris tenuis]|uniref:Condensin complex subunit 2 n=1 Tax=Nesidiocoris tenuis TaxID=355587 RepID=A0ABN7ABB5_9HEMI|nr:Hypothetical protein NTJ_01385 [Nesidiocoris tenuis]
MEDPSTIKGPEDCLDIELAQNSFNKLEEAIQGNGGFSEIQFLAPNTTNKADLGPINKNTMNCLAKVVDNLPDYDFSQDSAASVVNTALLSSSLKLEVRQLRVINEELDANNRQEEDQELSQRDSMDNTNKMIKGLGSAVDGAWDEDLGDEHKKMKKLKKRLNKALHTILDTCFSDDKEQLKDIFEVLNEKRAAGDAGFFKIPTDWPHSLVMFLCSASILESDDDDPALVRLSIAL